MIEFEQKKKIVDRYINNSKDTLVHPEDMEAFMDDGVEWIIEDLEADEELLVAFRENFKVDKTKRLAQLIWERIAPTMR